VTIGRDIHCAQCSDRGTVPSARWWDDEADREPCPRAGCHVALERAAQESDRSASQGPLRSDLAGTTPSPGGASDDAGVFVATRRAS
jgi:hypothetical protein